ncbi:MULTISPECIES: hypothetical protein [Lactobacillus]|uniref:Uncharacterized protein n=1 Tax=Lactobacillus xujianguonis TaxID=2495899 RepID=A0A437SWM9_9LACO|nr:MULTISPECIES: hypothetical protein [Lactobacillus]RVU71227.1 hypothetical protein EJK17_03250 [Lactobacillus xujianguonis]
MKKKYLLVFATLGILVELGIIGFETNEQQAIDYRTDQARTELSNKQAKLKNMATTVDNSERQAALKQGGNEEELAKQEVAQNKAKKQVRKLLTMLYTYDSGDEKLKIPDKIKESNLVSRQLLQTKSMFQNNKQLKLQYSGADMTGQIDELNLTTGILDNDEVPVYASVYFEMTKDSRTLGTPTDAYHLVYDMKTNEITAIDYLGRYQIDREDD